MVIFKRKLYQKMLDWKKEFDGRTALLIKGARRVGKSTLVEEFAKNEYESYILIDFSIASKELKGLFDDLSDLNYLFLRLQMIYHVDRRTALLIKGARRVGKSTADAAAGKAGSEASGEGPPV